MSDQETYKIHDLIDGVIKKNGMGEYSFDYSHNSFEDVLQDYCEIKLKHNDSVEFLTESSRIDDFRILASRVVGRGFSEDNEDMANLLTDLACDYFREEFVIEVDNRCYFYFLEDNMFLGSQEHIYRENGEVVWIAGMGRSL